MLSKDLKKKLHINQKSRKSANKNTSLESNTNNNYTIIIPAYKAQDFLDECLRSIKNQTLFNNNNNNVKYEILLGIDACDLTLKKATEIKDSYKNLKIYYFKNNYGPYIIRNTLLQMASYPLILFFDSDDHMKENMMSVIDSKMKEGYDICKVKYYNYNNGTYPNQGIIKPKVADGVGCHRKEVHDILGGFEEWRCGADSDFCFRSEKIFKISKISTPLFYRRIHSNSLTQNKETNPRSPMRIKYATEIKNRETNGYYEKPQKVNIKPREFIEI